MRCAIVAAAFSASRCRVASNRSFTRFNCARCATIRALRPSAVAFGSLRRAVRFAAAPSYAPATDSMITANGDGAVRGGDSVLIAVDGGMSGADGTMAGYAVAAAAAALTTAVLPMDLE